MEVNFFVNLLVLTSLVIMQAITHDKANTVKQFEQVLLMGSIVKHICFLLTSPKKIY